MSALNALKAYLASLPQGPIADSEGLGDVLAPAWDSLDGGDNESMEPHKLSRMEDPSWQRPYLSFTIERHGGTAMGSSRAELQTWYVNVGEGTAGCGITGFRQLVPNDRPLTGKQIEKMAREIAAVIRLRAEGDNRVDLKDDGRVKILIANIIPATNKETTTQRRRRFYRALDAELDPHWKRSGCFYKEES